MVNCISESKLVSHVGLYYSNPYNELYSFQLLDQSGKAVAGIDYSRGIPNRFYATQQLFGRQNAIIRLASIHLKKERQKIRKEFA